MHPLTLSDHFNPRRNRIILILSCLCLLLTLLASLSCSQQHSQTKLKNVTLAHWGHEKVFIYFPLYIAMQKGYFANEGINVKILYSGNDDQVFASVIAGEAQFGFADPAFVAISRERGGPGKVIATLVGRVANWGIGKGKTIPVIQNFKLLSRLKVSSFPAPSTA
jgi:NitT/TauT family transport system substrate-binding protein